MTTIYTLEKGQYVIGDPFEILPSSIYEGIWGELYGYMEGSVSAHGYPLIIYTTYYDEKETIYRDNIDREYIIKSNNLCIAHQMIAKPIETLETSVTIDVLSKAIVYHSKKHLYFNIDDNSTFCIDIGELETPDNISDTNSVDEFVKEYSMKDYEHEYDVENSTDEEFDAENVMKLVKERVNSGKPLSLIKLDGDEDEDDEDEEKTPQTTFSFFKKKKA